MASAPPHQDHDGLVAEFCSLTHADPSQATAYLEASQWDLQSAVAEFYYEPAEQTEPTDGMAPPRPDDDYQPSDEEETQLQSSGGQRLGDTSDPQPIPTTSSQSQSSTSRKAQKKPQKKFATLGDFGGDGHNHDDDDSDDDEEPDHDLYTGGEKSGLAVQNPDDLKKKILEKARKTKPRGGDDPKPRPTHFTGTARTLGGEDTESQTIEPPTAPVTSQRPPRVERILHFWNDGFSVDDGDLYRTDDRRNQEILDGIRQGRAPLSIMNVLPGQEVDVEIKQHQENYVKPKKKYQPFGGSGMRLGSPTPGDPSVAVATPPAAPAAPAAASLSSAPMQVDVNESEPMVSLQIRLADGTRLSSRFNTTHTIGDVYSFVMASRPQNQGQEWVLMTTFPSKELSDKSVVLGDLSEFKRGGVVVQKLQK